MKKFKYDINKYDPKKMMAVPAALFAVAAIIVVITFILTGLPHLQCFRRERKSLPHLF